MTFGFPFFLSIGFLRLSMSIFSLKSNSGFPFFLSIGFLRLSMSIFSLKSNSYLSKNNHYDDILS